jgi:lysophospholipase L1-like esterase
MSLGLGLSIGRPLRGGAAAITPYLGWVSNRGYVANRVHLTNTQFMSRTRHRMRVGGTSIRCVTGSWQNNVGTLVETAAGAAGTIRGTITRDGTNFARFQWGGLATGAHPDNVTLVSDPLAFSWSASDLVTVDLWRDFTTGRCVYAEGQGNPTDGDAFRIGTSGVVDATGGGVMSGGAAANTFYGGPIGLIADTTQPSFLGAGDSINYGFGDDVDGNADLNSGVTARALSEVFGIVNASRSGHQASFFVAQAPKQAALAQYASAVAICIGRNDIDAGRTQTQIQNDLLAMAAMFSGKQVFITTIPPKTDAGNTTPAGTNAMRNAINAWMATRPEFAGVWNINAALEGAGGLWAAGMTGDGIHPSIAGYAAAKAQIVTSGVRYPV